MISRPFQSKSSSKVYDAVSKTKRGALHLHHPAQRRTKSYTVRRTKRGYQLYIVRELQSVPKERSAQRRWVWSTSASGRATHHPSKTPQDRGKKGRIKTQEWLWTRHDGICQSLEIRSTQKSQVGFSETPVSSYCSRVKPTNKRKSKVLNVYGGSIFVHRRSKSKSRQGRIRLGDQRPCGEAGTVSFVPSRL